MKTLNEKLNTINEAINDALGEDAPSWQRRVISATAAIVVYAGIASAGVIVTNMIVASLAGTSIFLAMFISIISFMVTFIAGMTAATRVHAWCMDFNYANVERRVSGWFKRSEVAKADARDEAVTTKRRAKAAKTEPQPPSTRTRRANGLATAH